MPDSAVLLQEFRGPVATLTLNRPAQANTLSQELMDRLEEAVHHADANADVRVIIIGAAGKIFCAGHDLAEMQAANSGPASQAMFERLFARCSRMMLTIRRAKKPVIAKIQGAAVAAGCQLAASCDLAYAAEQAKFGVNGINLGLFCSTPSVALSRAVMPKQAMELLLTGQLIDAARAVETGLINRAVPAQELEGAVEAVAHAVAGKLPAAVELGKDLFWRQLGMSEAEAYALAGARMADNIVLQETRDLITGFLKPR
ncbi:MAG: enoyl-CoA hydratase [Beijerinckiaceae bacterium]